MASTARNVEGHLYAHGGQVFAFLNTEQPYDLRQCAELRRRTQHASGRQLGTLELRLIEDPRFPQSQGFAVLNDRPGADRRRFEAAVRQIYAGATLDLAWVTNFQQEGGSLFLALIARRILSRI